VTPEIRAARSTAEVRDALELICRSFPISYEEAAARKSAWQATIPEDFEPERFVIAAVDGRVAGAFHLNERRMSIGGVETDVLATTDYCVDKTAVPDPAFGVNFYIEGLKLIRGWPYPIVMGCARRMLTNYYYWFGYGSCHTYSEAHVEKLNVPARAGAGLAFVERFDEAQVSAYERLRRTACAREWMYFQRKPGFWKFLGHQVRLGRFRFLEIRSDTELAGFVMTGDGAVVDAGFSASRAGDVVAAVLRQLQSSVPDGRVVLKLSARNAFFDHVGLSHVAFRTRHVPDEGCVARTLDTTRLVDLFCRVLANTRPRGETELSVGWSGRLRFTADPQGAWIPQFESASLGREGERELLNVLFMGDNNQFSLVRHAGRPWGRPTLVHVSETECM
jgi:hypothetical protein